MVKVPLLKLVERPVGKDPAEMVAPVALPPTVNVILVIAALWQITWVWVAAAELSVIVPRGFTVMVPLSETLLQGPVAVTV